MHDGKEDTVYFLPATNAGAGSHPYFHHFLSLAKKLEVEEPFGLVGQLSPHRLCSWIYNGYVGHPVSIRNEKLYAHVFLLAALSFIV